MPATGSASVPLAAVPVGRDVGEDSRYRVANTYQGIAATPAPGEYSGLTDQRCSWNLMHMVAVSIRHCSVHCQRVLAMKFFVVSCRSLVATTLLLFAAAVTAADYPAPSEGSWVARDFRFGTGETLSELRINYTTVGNPSGEPVLILHGTTQSGSAMLNPAFAGELFGPGQPLMPRVTSSSCPMRLATASPASRRMVCERASRGTAMTTWSWPSTVSSQST